ncbi:MAG: pilus assembly protein PilP [Mariprofundales bacterium]
MTSAVKLVVLMVLMVWSVAAWANVEPTAVKSGNDQREVRQVSMLFLQSMATGQRADAERVAAAPTESRLREKLSLMLTRRIELMSGGDVLEDVLAPMHMQKEWGLLLTRQQRPKADRDKVKLGYILLHKIDDQWRVVPKVIFSDPSLNVSRDPSAQSLLRWFRANQRRWIQKFVVPLMKDEALPDAMQHMAVAPAFNIDQLRDPFASYLALVSKHSVKVLQARKSKLISRPKEALESFDLSSLRLVAIYAIHDKRVAMFEDSEGLGHTVEVGNYMGKDNGKITAIADGTVHLMEEMINPLGGLEHKEMLLTLASDEDTNP